MKEIEISRGYCTMVDDEYYDEISKYKWCYSHGYAIRNSSKINGKRKHIYMHRVINDTPTGLQTDHIDGNTLNNQKCNLRLATTQQNQHNRCTVESTTSIYKGVCYRKRDLVWIAKTKHYGKSIHLGTFKKESDAAIAYNNYAKDNFGEYARLNVIP
jgi:hypothetical protein